MAEGSPVIIDVREPYEFAHGHVAGALNVPLGEIHHNQNVLSMPKDRPVLVYCRSGARSAAAVDVLRKLGFTHAVNGINQAHIETELGRV